MLRLGLLGCDARMAKVAAAAVRRGDRLVAAWHVGDALPKGLDVPRLSGWEPLLDAASCDAVLIGSAEWGDAGREAVRTLVQAGRTLVLAQPLELSMLWAYELDMIRRDTGATLVPCLPDRLHPFIARLRERIEAAAGGVADAESLQLERRMPERSREAVLGQFARDVDLIRVLAGDPAKLATLGAADADTAWPTLAVGLTGPGLVPARWQVAPAGDPGLTIRLQSGAGSVVVDIPDDPARPWTLDGVPPDAPGFDPDAAVLTALDRALGHGQPLGQPLGDALIPAASWSDAARAVELAETVPRSLARGRAIDLHREEFTDLGTFRGTMASLGCGLIVLALVVVIVATLVAGVAREFRWDALGWLADAWPAAVLAVLGVFLALQTIPLLMGRSTGDQSPGRPDRP
ncbi:MAG: hypothetical protein ACKO4T_15125 [Planctomycetaceae bacterium]